MSSNLSNIICSWREEFRLKNSILIQHWRTVGFFVDSELDDINCYWFQFEVAPVINHLILGIIFLIIFVIGTLANALVVYIMST